MLEKINTGQHHLSLTYECYETITTEFKLLALPNAEMWRVQTNNIKTSYNSSDNSIFILDILINKFTCILSHLSNLLRSGIS